MTTLGRIALSVMLAVSGLYAGAPTLAQADSDTGPARASLDEQEVFGFLPYWELSSETAIDFEVLTTLAWFSVEAGRDLVEQVDDPGDRQRAPLFDVLGQALPAQALEREVGSKLHGVSAAGSCERPFVPQPAPRGRYVRGEAFLGLDV